MDRGNHRIRVLTPEVPCPVISSVLNGASFAEGVSPGAIAVLHGSDFASSFASASALPRSAPQPTSLLGTSVTVADSTWARRDAGLYSVAPTEIRLQLPDKTAIGLVTVTVNRAGAKTERLAVQETAVAPGLFSSNGDGRGVAAVSAFRIARNGRRTDLDVARHDPRLGWYVAVPLDLGSLLDKVYLHLYGTGIRGGTRAASVKIRGKQVIVESSEPSDAVHGVDEVVVGPLSRSLRRRESDVVVMVDGQTSITVTIAVK